MEGDAGSIERPVGPGWAACKAESRGASWLSYPTACAASCAARALAACKNNMQRLVVTTPTFVNRQPLH